MPQEKHIKHIGYINAHRTTIDDILLTMMTDTTFQVA